MKLSLNPSLLAFRLGARRFVLCLGLAFPTLVSSGCVSAATTAGKRFTAEYNCQRFQAKELSKNVARVEGCGHVATYVCSVGSVANQCIKESQETSQGHAQRTHQAERNGVKIGESKQGHRAVQVTFKRTEGSLTFSALPIHEPADVRIKLSVTRACLSNCEARLAVDGELLALTSKVATRQNGKEFELGLPAQSLTKLATGAKATLRLSELSWHLTDDDQQLLQEFIMTCRQEQALAGQVTPVSQGSAPSDSL